MTTTVVTVGHGSYTGINKMRMCFSKAQAVRVLRARGVKRDDARKLVLEVCKKPAGYGTLTVNHNTIEVRNEQWSIEQGYFTNMDELRRYWKQSPEE